MIVALVVTPELVETLKEVQAELASSLAALNEVFPPAAETEEADEDTISCVLPACLNEDCDNCPGTVDLEGLRLDCNCSCHLA